MPAGFGAYVTPGIVDTPEDRERRRRLAEAFPNPSVPAFGLPPAAAQPPLVLPGGAGAGSAAASPPIAPARPSLSPTEEEYAAAVRQGPPERESPQWWRRALAAGLAAFDQPDEAVQRVMYGPQMRQQQAHQDRLERLGQLAELERGQRKEGLEGRRVGAAEKQAEAAMMRANAPPRKPAPPTSRVSLPPGYEYVPGQGEFGQVRPLPGVEIPEKPPAETPFRAAMEVARAKLPPGSSDAAVYEEALKIAQQTSPYNQAMQGYRMNEAQAREQDRTQKGAYEEIVARRMAAAPLPSEALAQLQGDAGSGNLTPDEQQHYPRLLNQFQQLARTEQMLRSKGVDTVEQLKAAMAQVMGGGAAPAAAQPAEPMRRLPGQVAGPQIGEIKTVPAGPLQGTYRWDGQSWQPVEQ